MKQTLAVVLLLSGIATPVCADDGPSQEPREPTLVDALQALARADTERAEDTRFTQQVNDLRTGMRALEVAQSLVRVPSFMVLVEDIPRDLEKTGLSSSRIKDQVELKLRIANLPVVDSARSYLHVQAGAACLEADPVLCGYSLEIGFNQPVVLVYSLDNDDLEPTIHEGKLVFYTAEITSLGSTPEEFFDLLGSPAVTWSLGKYGVASAGRLKEAVVEGLLEMVGQFMNEFLKAQQMRQLEKELQAVYDKREAMREGRQ